MTLSPNGSFTATYIGLPSFPVARASCDSVIGFFGFAVEEVDIGGSVLIEVCTGFDGCLPVNRMRKRAMERIVEMTITSTG